MIVNYGADPDRVYLHGYSAGGDGVYQITPRLADRFAAANMSAGHPNDVSLLNLSNLNFCQQAGIRDYYSEDAMRSVNVARYDQILSDYRNKYGFGYEHTTFIHVPEGHIFDDYDDVSSSVLREPVRFAECAVEADALDLFLDVFESVGQERDVPMLSYYYEDDEEFDNGIKDAVTNTLGLEVENANTNAIRYVSSFTRSAAPEKFVWDLSTRAPRRGKDSFYWLEADSSVDKGIITASFDRASNTITVEPNPDVNGDFAILFHPDLVDVTRPVTIKTPKGDRKVLVNPSEEFLRASMYECGDPKLGCVGKIMYSELASTAAGISIPGETLLTQGMEKALSAATEPEGIPVTWSSSDTKVALVDGNGVVTGLKTGTATITAAITVDGKEYSASCKVTVVPAGYIPSDSSGGGHIHKFVWESIEATQDADGELRYRCEGCGEIQTRVPLTAYYVFNRNTAEKIRKAGKDATVKVETNKWISFHKMVMEALADRPDVTLEISFLDEGYKGKRCTVVIPKGTDTMSLVDKNGFAGFLYLGGRFGMKTN
ncbi:MAG: Ig-like domain-containing protein [Butyrivibrio sp.]|nr:Ig-like domain-containing protein [Butyrivibrio sp.]